MFSCFVCDTDDDDDDDDKDGNGDCTFSLVLRLSSVSSFSSSLVFVPLLDLLLDVL